MWKNQYALFFLQPVDAKVVVGYYDKIKEPMDYSTAFDRLRNSEALDSLAQFRDDMRQVFINCSRFNVCTCPDKSKCLANLCVASLGVHCSKQFEELWRRTGMERGIQDEARAVRPPVRPPVRPVRPPRPRGRPPGLLRRRPVREAAAGGRGDRGYA